MQIRTSGSYIVSDTIKYFAENERMSQCLLGVGGGGKAEKIPLTSFCFIYLFNFSSHL